MAAVPTYAGLCAVISAAFQDGLTEPDYHTLVALLRAYAASPRESPAEEQRVRAAHGWPHHYDPCDFMEKLRFAFTFRGSDTRASALLLAQVSLMNKS